MLVVCTLGEATQVVIAPSKKTLNMMYIKDYLATRLVLIATKLYDPSKNLLGGKK
jgi:hypothetical protein